MASSKRTDYRTPRALYEMLQLAIGGDFAVDAAADSTNHLCDRWFGPGGVQEDALVVPEWPSPAFCNPPYDRNIDQWCKKFYEQAQLGCDIVALLPAKIETDWWYRWVIEVGADVLFLVGRVPFDKPPDVPVEAPWYPPMFPSAIVSYNPMMSGQVMWLDWRQRGRKARVGEEESPADSETGSGTEQPDLGSGVGGDQADSGE